MGLRSSALGFLFVVPACGAGKGVDPPADSGDRASDTGDTADTPDSGDTAATPDSGDTGERPPGPITGEQRLDRAATHFEGATAADRLGWDVAHVGDVNGDGCAGLALGAHTARSTGVAYLVCDPPGGLVDASAAATAILVGLAVEDHAGLNLAGNADFDGDGLPDLAISAPYADGGSGAVYLLSGPFSGEVSVATRWLQVGGGPDEGFGEDLTMVGDVTGDGAPDIAIGANEAAGTEEKAGMVSILSAGTGRVGEVAADQLDVRLHGAYAEYAGDHLSRAGDLDGDGIDDLLVGGNSVGSSAHPGGVAWIVLGPLSGASALDDAGMVVEGSESGGGIRTYTGGLGDLDEDGYRDVGVGLPWVWGAAGAVYVLHGPPGAVVEVDAAETIFYGTSSARQFSAGLPVEAGDMDADGHGDLAVGMVGTYGDIYGVDDEPIGEVPGAGAVAVLFGPFARGAHELGDADAIWRGSLEHGHAGEPLAPVGDADGDGCADLLVGSWAYFDYQGHAWLVGGCG